MIPATRVIAAPGEDADPAAGSTGDEILVTARRRAESAQDVPIALTVLGGRELEGVNVQTLDQIKQYAPSLLIVPVNPRNTAINIRNLGSNASTSADGLENGVGVYIDDVYYARPGQSTFDLIDIDRVEILKGPQGTLFGKNTTAGAISIATRQPSFDPEGEAELSYGNLDYVQARGAITGPIVADRLAFRLSGSLTRRDGFIRNLRTGRDIHDLDSNLIRGQLLLTPSAAVRVRIIGDYATRSEDCCVGLPDGFAPGSNFAVRAARVGYVLPVADSRDHVTDINGEQHYRVRQGGLSGQIDVDLGAASLTSITAWRRWTWLPKNDVDQTGLSLFDLGQTSTRQRQLSQELRLASNGVRTIDYVVGLYYFHQVLPTTVLTGYGADAPPFIFGPQPTAAQTAALDGFTVRGFSRAETDSYAGFAQATWHIAPRFEFTGGLRYTWEKKTGRYEQSQLGGADLATLDPAVAAAAAAIRNGFGAPGGYDARQTSSKLSGQATISYRPADDVLTYATFARGFKSGGLNLTNLPPGLSPLVGPETVDHYEVGLKSALFDRVLTFNAALFRDDVGGYQATIVDAERAVSYLANAASVRSEGVEVETRLRPAEGLGLFASATYADTKYRSYATAPCPYEAPAPACDLSGQTLPNAPRWSISAGGDFSAPVGRMGAADIVAFGGADYGYRSRYGSNVDNTIYGYVDGYQVVNARAGLRAADQGWSAHLFARNLFDARYAVRRNLGAFNSGLIVDGVGDPRTYGVTFRTQF